MNLKEHELRDKYRYTKLSYVFDIYSEFEHRVNSTEEEYEGLKTGEVRFDYATWERRLEYSHKQMIRAIKELVNEGYIIQTFKGKKGEGSKYFLTRFEEQKKEQKEDRNKSSNAKGSEGFEEQKKEQKRVHTSIYSNQDIKSNIYMDLTFIDDVVKIENVKLTQEQYDTLKDKYGESNLHNTIVSLNTYIANGQGKKYKNHYLTLNNWLRNNKSKDNIIHLNNRDFKRTPVKNNNDELRKELEEEGLL